ERATRCAAVAHTREQPQSFACQPVRRALVAEQLAPAARACTAALVLPVGDRAGARRDVDAFLAGERACPATYHVVATAVTSGWQRGGGRRVQHGHQRGVLAVSREAEERERQIAGGDAALLQSGLDAMCQHGPQPNESDFKVI